MALFFNGEVGLEAVVNDERHPHFRPLSIVGVLVQQLGGDVVVAVAKYVGFDVDRFTGNGFDGKLAFVYFGDYMFDDHAGAAFDVFRDWGVFLAFRHESGIWVFVGCFGKVRKNYLFTQ